MKSKKGEIKGKEREDRIVRFPASVLKPVSLFLRSSLSNLLRTRDRIVKEDPFQDTERLVSNASPDDDAAEQFGHARVSAIRKEVDRKIIQTRKALARIKIGKYGICESCGKMIDTDRLVVYPEATLCAKCQAEKEK